MSEFQKQLINPKEKVGYVVKMYPRLSETFILHELVELQRQGQPVTVFSLRKPNEGRFHPHVAELTAPVFYLDDAETKKLWQLLSENWSWLADRREHLWSVFEEVLQSSDLRLIEIFFAACAVAAKALKEEVGHLHAHFASLPSTVAWYASRISGLPFSFTAHAKDIYRYLIDRNLLARKLSAARFVVTVTEFNRRYLLEQYPHIPAEKIGVLYNGVDLDFFSPDGNQARHNDFILSIGRLVAKKGFADLLRACALLRTRGRNFRCVIVGQGEEEQNLRTLRQQLGLESDVELVGAKTQPEILPLLRSATVLCLPCTIDADGNQDALPTVLLEALACGLPVISTGISGIPEIVDSGTDGLLVEFNQPEQLAAALTEILDHPDLQRRFSRNGRFKAETKFDLKKNVTKLRNLFRESLQQLSDSHSTLPVTTPGCEGSKGI